jgi:flagellar hook-associated protein 2
MTTISSTSSSTGTTGTTSGTTSATTSGTSATSGTSSTTSTDPTSTGSATEALLTELGVSGNINATGLADELSQAQYAGQVDQLNSRSTALTTEISDASSLMNMTSSLASSLDSMINAGQLSSAPQIANSNVATVSTGSVQGSGTSTLEVDSLAQGQTIASPTIAAGATDVGSGSLTISFGTVSGSTFTAGSTSPVTINVAQGAKLSDVATAINNAGAGVTAYVATNSNGQQLVITGPQGAANAFTVSATENASDPGLSQFAWAPGTSGSGSSGSGAALAASASDASYILDGVQRTSASNSISDAAPGISLNLTGTNPGNPTTISFTDPTQAITTGMNDLVSALNTIVGQLNTDTAAGGPLGNNPGANALQQALSGLSTTTIMPDATTGQPSTLSDLGLTTNKDGTFTLDTTILDSALQNNPQAVAAMFTTGLNGVYGTIDNISQSVNDPVNGNSLAGTVSDMQTQQSTIATQLSTIATQQATLRTQLVSQYAALNSVVSADKSTQSFLTQQVALWTNSTSTTSG